MNVFWLIAGVSIVTAVIVLFKYDSEAFYVLFAGVFALSTFYSINMDIPEAGSATITNVIAFGEYCIIDVSLRTRGDFFSVSWEDTLSLSSEECNRILSTGKHHSYNEFLQWKESGVLS